VSEPNIVIREYDPAWQKLFEGLRERLLDALGGLAVAVEHVGSTAVPGLAAKPIVDIDAVVTSAEDVPLAVERLERAGYRHEGDLSAWTATSWTSTQNSTKSWEDTLTTGPRIPGPLPPRA
jgi:GrpB-like predicted nucleotidyltransferase (UPF0157 family)